MERVRSKVAETATVSDSRLHVEDVGLVKSLIGRFDESAWVYVHRGCKVCWSDHSAVAGGEFPLVNHTPDFSRDINW